MKPPHRRPGHTEDLCDLARGEQGWQGGVPARARLCQYLGVMLPACQRCALILVAAPVACSALLVLLRPLAQTLGQLQCRTPPPRVHACRGHLPVPRHPVAVAVARPLPVQFVD